MDCVMKPRGLAAVPAAAGVLSVPTPCRQASGQQAGEITLRGSTDTIVEFFGYAINNIIFVRGIAPPEKFKAVQKYGLPIQVTSDQSLEQWLSDVLQQVRRWLLQSHLRKLVFVISSRRTDETLERWTFDIQVCEEALSQGQAPTTQEDVRKCQRDIQAIMRQVASSVAFLPLLTEPCDFDILVHTDTLADMPVAWDKSDPKLITGESQEVRLRSFTTKMHVVEGGVSYKCAEY